MSGLQPGCPSKGFVKKAMELYEAASGGGQLHATLNLSVLHEDQGNVKKAVELYETASRGSHIRSG